MGLTRLNETDSLADAGMEIVEKDYESYLALDSAVTNPKTITFPDFYAFNCNLTNSACTVSNANQLTDAHQWQLKNQKLIDAVEQIVRNPSFSEQLALPQHYRASWRQFLSMRTYKWIEASHLWLARKPESAATTILPYLQFCRNLLKTSQLLITRRMAIACVANDMKMIADWYVSRPEHSHRLTSALQDWLKPFSLDEKQMGAAILNEVRIISQIPKTLTSERMQADRAAQGMEIKESHRLAYDLTEITLSSFTKPNENAQEIYEKFSGVLTWAESGAVLIDPPWNDQSEKSWKRFLSRNLWGRHLSSSIDLKAYEADLHNMQTPVLYQTLLSAVRFCTTDKPKTLIKECLKKDVTSYVGPFYTDPIEWVEEHRFVWLPAPESLQKTYGYAKIYLNAQ